MPSLNDVRPGPRCFAAGFVCGCSPVVRLPSFVRGRRASDSVHSGAAGARATPISCKRTFGPGCRYSGSLHPGASRSCLQDWDALFPSVPAWVAREVPHPPPGFGGSWVAGRPGRVACSVLW